MKSLLKNFIFIILIFLVISGVFAMFSKPFEEKKEISLTQLVEDLNQEKIRKITVLGNNIEIIYSDESKAKAKKETESSFSETLINYGLTREKINKTDIEVKEERGLMFWLSPISIFLFPEFVCKITITIRKRISKYLIRIFIYSP